MLVDSVACWGEALDACREEVDALPFSQVMCGYIPSQGKSTDISRIVLLALLCSILPALGQCRTACDKGGNAVCHLDFMNDFLFRQFVVF
jgi:hypothetical protein